ncbi:hypothetical protein RZ56_02950 [Apilactobacillus kunkeei]|nr:hypothetical protein RZ56_02950 [Apilactobacillus kunkeei]
MNFIKDFKTKSPKAFWTIIVVVVALVIVGFANNNNNGSPFSFSKTPQKMIEDGGTDKIWKVNAFDEKSYYKFGSNGKVSIGDDKDEVSSVDGFSYKFENNDELKVTIKNHGYLDFKDLKVENNEIKGKLAMSFDGKNVGTDVTFTPAN